MQIYEGNWATYEILKKFFKSKQYYKKRITSLDNDNDSDSDNKDVILKDGVNSNNGKEDGDGEGDGNGVEDGDGDCGDD